MNLTYNILLSLFILTALLVIKYDWTIQKIPIVIIVLNYISICILVNPFLLIGLIAIIIAKVQDVSIDILYLFVIGYLIIIVGSIYSLISIVAISIYILLSTNKNISLMVPLELAILIEIIIKEMNI